MSTCTGRPPRLIHPFVFVFFFFFIKHHFATTFCNSHDKIMLRVIYHRVDKLLTSDENQLCYSAIILLILCFAKGVYRGCVLTTMEADRRSMRREARGKIHLAM